MPGSITSTPPPGSGLLENASIAPFSPNTMTSIGVDFPAGMNYLISVPAPYSTDGPPPDRIPYLILPTIRETMTIDHQQVYQEYLCHWRHRTFFMQALLGDAVLSTDPTESVLFTPGQSLPPPPVGPAKIRRRLPPRHPNYPHLIPTRVELIEGKGIPWEETFGADRKLMFIGRSRNGEPDPYSYRAYAHYGVTWESVDYDLATDAQVDAANNILAAQGLSQEAELKRYVSRYATFSGESISLTGNNFFKFLDGTTAGSAVPHKVFPTKEVHYVLHQWPVIPEAAIRNLLGKANNAAFDTDPAVGANYALEELLFAGAKYERGRTPTGRYTYTIDLTMLWRPNGWRKVLKPGMTFTFAYVKTDGGQYIYDLGDFGSLFRPPS